MSNSSKRIKTDYASAERASAEVLKRQSRLLVQNSVLTQVADSVSSIVAVLNKERQVVYGNKLFLDRFGANKDKTLVGMRPGEVFLCIHASKSKHGCGTTRFCTVCGAVNAILEAQKGIQSEKECRITTNENDALDLRVTATPYIIDGIQYIFFAASDISDEKRRKTLERVFFHDILNSAGGISGLTSIMPLINDLTEMTETAEVIHRAANFLVDEIKSQRILNVAESGDLVLSFSNVESTSILKELGELYSRHEVIGDKILSISKNSPTVLITTDAVLLRRVLGNMTKNALEASVPGGEVYLSCQEIEDRIRFNVHNDVFIPTEIQLQLFKRSFSTKGIGRGIGTYSMKLFGEKYLNGNVGFESTEENGTTFFIEIQQIHPKWKAVGGSH